MRQCNHRRRNWSSWLHFVVTKKFFSAAKVAAASQAEPAATPASQAQPATAEITAAAEAEPAAAKIAEAGEAEPTASSSPSNAHSTSQSQPFPAFACAALVQRATSVRTVQSGEDAELGLRSELLRRRPWWLLRSIFRLAIIGQRAGLVLAADGAAGATVRHQWQRHRWPSRLHLTGAKRLRQHRRELVQPRAQRSRQGYTDVPVCKLQRPGC
jgi:hypothetical protein